MPEALDQNYINKFIFPLHRISGCSIPDYPCHSQTSLPADFRLGRKGYPLPIPVTHSFNEKAFFQMEGFLNAFLFAMEHPVVLARLPLKLLAVRSGFAFYGRNNLSYIPGLGS